MCEEETLTETQMTPLKSPDFRIWSRCKQWSLCRATLDGVSFSIHLKHFLRFGFSIAATAFFFELSRKVDKLLKKCAFYRKIKKFICVR